MRALIRSTVVLLMLLHETGAAGQSAESQGPPVAAADRLFVAILVPTSGVVDQLYQSESDRLDGLCKGRPIGCLTDSFRAGRVEVGVVRAEPRTDGAVAATIYATLKVRRGFYYGDPKHGEFESLDVALDVEARKQPGVYHRWIQSIGDWGYGVHVEGVRVRNQWVQLVNPSAIQGWLAPELSALSVRAHSIQGEIVRLERLNARWPDTTRKAITPGNFLILSVKGVEVEFREEVEADFACDGPVPLPPVMPPTLHATADEFFNADGSSRFSIVYTKGC